MTTITKIWDQSANTNGINKSTVFTNADFLIIEDSLPSNEGYELTLNVAIKVDGFTEKEIPLWVCESFKDTKAIIPLPKEVTQTEYDCYVNFFSDLPISITIYAVSLDINLSDIKLDTEDIINILTDVLSKVNQVKFTTDLNQLEISLIAANQVAQNTALSIVSTGLIPLTGGVSGGAIPVLSGGSSLLLPAI